MILDRNYFNSIRLNTRRGKYYDIEAVDRLLVDIRSRADSMNREYADACRKLAEAVQTADALREENADLFMKGQALSQEVLSLRDELKAAQSGEAFVIPESDDSLTARDHEAADEGLHPAEADATSETEASGEPLIQSAEFQISDSPAEEEASDEEEPSFAPVDSVLSPLDEDRAASASAAMIAEARQEADKILASAYAEAAGIRSSAHRLQSDTVAKLESVFAMIREINTYSIEKTDRIRQEFLDRLPEEEEAAPPDMTEKIGRIAQQLSEIEEDGDADSL